MTGLQAPKSYPLIGVDEQWTYKGCNHTPKAFDHIYMSDNYMFDGVWESKKHNMKQSDHRPVCATSEEQIPTLVKFVRRKPPACKHGIRGEARCSERTDDGQNGGLQTCRTSRAN